MTFIHANCRGCSLVTQQERKKLQFRCINAGTIIEGRMRLETHPWVSNAVQQNLEQALVRWGFIRNDPPTNDPEEAGKGMHKAAGAMEK